MWGLTVAKFLRKIIYRASLSMYRVFINKWKAHQHTELSIDPFIDVANRNNWLTRLHTAWGGVPQRLLKLL